MRAAICDAGFAVIKFGTHFFSFSPTVTFNFSRRSIISCGTDDRLMEGRVGEGGDSSAWGMRGHR